MESPRPNLHSLIRFLTVSVFAVLLTGCAIQAFPAAAKPHGARTIRVQNLSLDPITVYVSGQRIGWVEPQQSACLAFPWDDAIVGVRIHSVGRRLTVPAFAPGVQPAWRLIVYNEGNAQETELFGVRESCGEPGVSGRTPDD